ncbi:MAG TPA: hypothetical protein VGD04_00790 [Methylophilus sp.]
MVKLWLLVGMLLGTGVSQAATAIESSVSAPVVAVVVSSNAAVAPVSTLAPNELRLIYWRKQHYWPNGLRIHATNLHAEHPLRLLFSDAVLNSLPNAQTDYWNGLYFHGVSPPRSLQSEEAVIRYVNDTRGSLGYIDACHVDARVKPILWIIHHQISTRAPEQLLCSKAN